MKISFFRISLLFSLLSVRLLNCEEKIISSFENSEEWKVRNLKGKLTVNFSLSEDSILDRKSLEIVLRSETDGINEAEIVKEVEENWSNFERIEFWVKGFSEGFKFYFEVEDKDGRIKEYYFVPDFQLYDIFTPEWRRITVKLDEEIINWKEIKGISFRTNRQGKAETKIKIDSLIAAKGPPSLKINIPKEFQRRKNGILDLLMVKSGILNEEERWDLERKIKEIYKDANIKVVKYSYIPWFYKGEFSSPFPSFHRELAKYDMIIFLNWDTDALDSTYQTIIKDYVEGGGNLLFLGGYYSFGSCKLKNKIIQDLMPLETIDYFDIKKRKAVLHSEVFKSLNGKNVLYYHKIVPKRETNQVIKDEKGENLGLYWIWGKGKVFALPLATFGAEEELKDASPFWKDESYNTFLRELFDFLLGGDL